MEQQDYNINVMGKYCFYDINFDYGKVIKQITESDYLIQLFDKKTHKPGPCYKTNFMEMLEWYFYEKQEDVIKLYQDSPDSTSQNEFSFKKAFAAFEEAFQNSKGFRVTVLIIVFLTVYGVVIR